jgi:poly(hydroxyalkanoate) granule-associated protein
MSEQQFSVLEKKSAVDPALLVDADQDESSQLAAQAVSLGRSRLSKLGKQISVGSSALWRANLGAAVLAGRNIQAGFDRLVDEGVAFQKAQKRKKNKRHTAKGKVETGVRSNAVARIHDIENQIDRGVNNTLHWIGMPSRKDFSEMSDKVNQLSESLDTLTTQLRDIIDSDKEIH